MSLQQVNAKRAVLLQRIARQRATMVEMVQSLQQPARLIDQGCELVQQVRHSPKVLLLLAAALPLLIFHKRLSLAKVGLVTLTAVRWWLALRNRNRAAAAIRR